MVFKGRNPLLSEKIFNNLFSTIILPKFVTMRILGSHPRKISSFDLGLSKPDIEHYYMNTFLNYITNISHYLITYADI